MQSANRVVAILLVILSTLSGCGGERSHSTLVIFTAASLADAFNEMADVFEAEHSGTKVVLSLAGSQQLAVQLIQQAPADVFASADNRQMQMAVRKGRIDPKTVRPMAGNRLTVVLPLRQPSRVARLEDLARPDVDVLLASEKVPAGRYSLAFLQNASAKGIGGRGYARAVLANVISYEQDVRTVLQKVEFGEADAGIVYASDVRDARVRQLFIPDSLNVEVSYWIAPLNDSRRPDLAAAFVALVTSDRGRRILAGHGFAPLPGGNVNWPEEVNATIPGDR